MKKGQSPSGEVPCHLPAPLAARTPMGTSSVAQCPLSLQDSGYAEPQHAGCSFLLHNPNSLLQEPSAPAAPSVLHNLPLPCAASLPLAAWDGYPPAPSYLQPKVPERIHRVKTVRLAPLQNSRQTLPPYLASTILANWAQSGKP